MGKLFRLLISLETEPLVGGVKLVLVYAAPPVVQFVSGINSHVP
jgi:hypothetical protein